MFDYKKLEGVKKTIRKGKRVCRSIVVKWMKKY